MMNTLKIGFAQMAPVWLNKSATINKIKTFISDAANQKCELLVFGEGILPGYPFWLSLTDGAKFNSPVQKEIHAHYIRNAVQIELGDLEEICLMAKQYKMAIYLGIIERGANRGGHSLYCSLVYIDEMGLVKSVHRKLKPTFEERLTWSDGDGHGLEVHSLKQFSLGGLNCWENWMPLARTALYAQGENLHIAVWPGSKQNTLEITKFIALESRSFVVSVSGLMSVHDFPADTPHLDKIVADAPDLIANGGSCLVGPDGQWIVEPILEKEGVFTAEIDFNKVLEERQNFDPSGHYSRPDVTKLVLNKERQSLIELLEK